MSSSNSHSAATDQSPHEMMYGIRLRNPLSLFKKALAITRRQEFECRKDAEECGKFAAMSMKQYYDKKHDPHHFNVGDKVYVKLEPGYSIPANKNLVQTRLRESFPTPWQELGIIPSRY